jgi:hypothetical protein
VEIDGLGEAGDAPGQARRFGHELGKVPLELLAELHDLVVQAMTRAERARQARVQRRGGAGHGGAARAKVRSQHGDERSA